MDIEMENKWDWEEMNQGEKSIVLASASPRRKELLHQAGIQFDIIISNVKEVITKTDPAGVVEELSSQKARAVAQKVKDGTIVIGADTVVALDGKILGKPADVPEAVDMLRALQGRTHQVYTGVTLLEKRNGSERVCTFSECTQVEMYPVSEEEINAYVATGGPMDKAGAYGIQGRAGVFVKRITGCLLYTSDSGKNDPFRYDDAKWRPDILNRRPVHSKPLYRAV